MQECRVKRRDRRLLPAVLAGGATGNASDLARQRTASSSGTGGKLEALAQGAAIASKRFWR
jgi:hypothetical protein